MSVDFTVNGEPCSLPNGSSLSDLMEDVETGGHAITIQVNRKPVLQKNWSQEIQAGDRVEIALSIPNSCFTGTHF